MSDVQKLLNLAQNKGSKIFILKSVALNEAIVNDLVSVSYHTNFRVSHSSAYALGIIAAEHPQLLFKHIPKMIKTLDQPPHICFVRNVLRTWQLMKDLPNKHIGEMYERSFALFMDKKLPHAIRVFAMSVCAQCCLHFPELKNEMLDLIIFESKSPVPSLSSRARHLLKKLL
jgi:hypothetical protein